MEKRRCPGCMNLTAAPVCEYCQWPADGRNDSHQLPAGTVLAGKYLVGRVLGQGGFGITYLGWDLNLDISICIKEYYPSHMVNRDGTVSTQVNCNTSSMTPHYSDSKERFLREAKALAKFRDIPQIVGIHDFFQMNNTAYMVMEFVQGIDLGRYVCQRGGRIRMEELLRIMKPVMEALDIVHAAGIIHRDISPDNIMLHPREGAKLLDFGAVRTVEHPDAEKELTRSTEAILKNGFAPMEQYVAKGSLGPWTDVYALCATFYYCLTGRIPTDAPMRMLEDEPLDWSAAQGLTAGQQAVLEQGLALRAKDRIGSVRELIGRLYTDEVQPEFPIQVASVSKQNVPREDSQKTVLMTDFKVNIPQQPMKPAPVQEPPKPTPAPVPEPAAQKQPDPPRQPLPATKKRKLWPVFAACGAVVVIVAAVLLIPRGAGEPEQLSQPSEQTMPAPETQPATTAPVPEASPISENLQVCRMSLANWGGFILDKNGTVWMWDIHSKTVKKTDITDVVSLAHTEGPFNSTYGTYFLKEDGLIAEVGIHWDPDSNKPAELGEPSTSLNPISGIVRIINGYDFVVILEGGKLVKTGKLIGLPAGIVSYQYVGVDHSRNRNVHFLAISESGQFYTWKQCYIPGQGEMLGTVTEMEGVPEDTIRIFGNPDDVQYVDGRAVSRNAYVTLRNGTLRVIIEDGTVAAELTNVDKTFYSDSCFYAISGDDLWAYGRHYSGALLNTNNSHFAYVQGHALSGYCAKGWAADIVDFAAGFYSAAAMKDNGDGTVSIYVWGENLPEGWLVTESGERFTMELP